MGGNVENEEPQHNIAHAGKRAFLKAFSETGNVKRSCYSAGIHRRTHYAWLENDPVYASAFKDAVEDAGDTLELLAVRQAKSGSTDMTKFLLQGLRPEKYRAITEHRHTGAGGGPIQIDLRGIGRLIMSDPGALDLALKLADMIQAAAFPVVEQAAMAALPGPDQLLNGHLNGHANGTLNG